MCVGFQTFSITTYLITAIRAVRGLLAFLSNQKITHFYKGLHIFPRRMSFIGFYDDSCLLNSFHVCNVSICIVCRDLMLFFLCLYCRMKTSSLMPNLII